MSRASEFDQRYAAEQLRRSRHPLRRLIKKFYLDQVLREATGATIDFGCGAGQLLERLPGRMVNAELQVAQRATADARTARQLEARNP